jgi:hypothetical protein
MPECLAFSGESDGDVTAVAILVAQSGPASEHEVERVRRLPELVHALVLAEGAHGSQLAQLLYLGESQALQ